jgi:acetyl-CoA acetyltransferase
MGQPNGELGLSRVLRSPAQRPTSRTTASTIDDYDAFAHLPIYGLEDLGFLPHGEAGAFIAGHNTAPGGKLPLNTNGGGLSHMHSGMYGV